jgi:hypothetical protein
MNTAEKLREIVGQETTPPLWIYVTKDQVPVLERAADELDGVSSACEQAFTAGTIFGAFSIQGRHEEAAAVLREFRKIGRKR